MSDIPWNLVVFIFIAFAAWIWRRLQEVAAERQRKQIERNRQARQQNQQGQNLRPAEEAKPTVDPMVALLKSMGVPVQEFIEEEEEEDDEEEEWIPTQARPRTTTSQKPPPLPGGNRSAAAPLDHGGVIVDQEKLATGSTMPIGAKTVVKRGKKARFANELRELLDDRGSLRSVLVATEILGPPKALQEEQNTAAKQSKF